jgi:aromatic ring-opening dioxygenase catalytic subunit (LigB family)
MNDDVATPHGEKPGIVTADTVGVLMPAAFFGHGNPMNALEVNRYTSAWRAFGEAVPRPRAILVISAHWLRRWMPAPRAVSPRG